MNCRAKAGLGAFSFELQHWFESIHGFFPFRDSVTGAQLCGFACAEWQSDGSSPVFCADARNDSR